MEQESQSRKYASFAISLIIHGFLFFFIAMKTLDATLPEGTVSVGTIEFNQAPLGSQTETLNVDIEEKSEQPEMVKSQPSAPPPPPPAAVVAPSPEPSEFDSLPSPEGLPVDVADNKTQETTPSPTEIAETTEESAIQDSVPTTTLLPLPEELPEKTAIEGSGNSVNSTTSNAGTDPVDLAPQAQTVAQTYGRADGLKDITTRTPLAGNKRPVYPTLSRLRGEQGDVLLQATITPDGNVSNLRVLKSPNSALQKSAVDAVSTWKYRPTGVQEEYLIPVSFRLSGDAQEMRGKLRRKE